MAPTPAPVLGALHLRAWALGALCGAHPPAPPPDAPAEAWRLFLSVERCALALAPLVSAAGGPAEIAADFAVAESRRVLSARGQLRRLEALVRARGWRVVALKGAVPLLRGAEHPTLQDLDVLAAPGDAAPLAQALGEAGYEAAGGEAAHVLPTRRARGDIPVEIHRMVPHLTDDLWERVRPVRADSALLSLHPADHLRHLLLHTTLHHPERRGCIRDLLLLAEALAHGTPRDVRDVRAAAAGERDRWVVEQQMEMAVAMAAREGPCPDPFEMQAAGVYLAVQALSTSSLPRERRDAAWHAAVAAVARSAGTPLHWDWTLDAESPRPGMAWLRRVAPRVERAVRVAARLGRAVPLLPFARSIAAAAEHAVRERAAHAASSVRSG
jgi:hypothetical protein